MFQVDVVSAPPSAGNFDNFKPDFTKYDVVVSNLDSATWPADLGSGVRAIRQRTAAEFVSVHAADNAFPKWVAFNEMIGVGGWRNRRQDAGPHWFYKDGHMEADTAPGAAQIAWARKLPFKGDDSRYGASGDQGDAGGLYARGR